MSAETPATAINGVDIRGIKTIGKDLVLGCVVIGWLFSLLYWIFLMAGKWQGHICMDMTTMPGNNFDMSLFPGKHVCLTVDDNGGMNLEQGWATFGKEEALKFFNGLIKVDIPMSGGAFAAWLFLLFSVFAFNPAAIFSMFKGTPRYTTGLLVALICIALIAFSSLAASKMETPPINPATGQTLTLDLHPTMTWGSTLNVFAVLLYAGALAVHLASDSTPTDKSGDVENGGAGRNDRL